MCIKDESLSIARDAIDRIDKKILGLLMSTFSVYYSEFAENLKSI